jgi:hypothetical protein
MLAVACALLEHADAAVVQAESYEGAGPGEIPSLPRLIPKILHSTLQHCVEEGQQGSGAMDCQAGLEKTQLFCKTSPVVFFCFFIYLPRRESF